MALDMEQLRKMFYEECRENLEVLENVLLHLDPQDGDHETINTIFRAAHSIKGGAATFNLLDISEFTHSVEAYLDKVRNHEAELSATSVDVLLKSCDVIGDMLAGHETGSDVDLDLKASVSHQLAQLLSSSPLGSSSPTQSADLAAAKTSDTQVGALPLFLIVSCFSVAMIHCGFCVNCMNSTQNVTFRRIVRPCLSFSKWKRNSATCPSMLTSVAKWMKRRFVKFSNGWKTNVS